MQVSEIGSVVHSRRLTLGLSQQRLAKMAGLSRATINQLETGALTDLGIAKLNTLLTLIGLELETRPNQRANGIVMASRTASVSYRRLLTASALSEALTTGKIPSQYQAHIAHLLDEAPLPLLVRVVEEIAKTKRISPKIIWQYLLEWAKLLKSPRAAWL